jgi:hypothetical protein
MPMVRDSIDAGRLHATHATGGLSSSTGVLSGLTPSDPGSGLKGRGSGKLFSVAKREPAVNRFKVQGEGRIWIDHAALADSDLEWLSDVEHLILWNVSAPPGFLAQLPRLRLLEIRGGSGADLSRVDGCTSLRGLEVTQVRGVQDLSSIADLNALEYLSLYGLKQVVTPPSLGSHSLLRRLCLGRMVGLTGLGGLLDAPALEELLLQGKVVVSGEDVARIQSHPSLRGFQWTPDGQVPDKQWLPVVEAIALAKPKPQFMREWFSLRDR